MNYLQAVKIEKDPWEDRYPYNIPAVRAIRDIGELALTRPGRPVHHRHPFSDSDGLPRRGDLAV